MGEVTVQLEEAGRKVVGRGLRRHRDMLRALITLSRSVREGIDQKVISHRGPPWI